MELRKNLLPVGERVEVYRNLTRGCLSVRHRGRVVYHLEEHEDITLEDCKLVVQPAGRQRVLDEGRKNVHAYISGTLMLHTRSPADYEWKQGQTYWDTGELFCNVGEAYYNPYKQDHWTNSLGNRVDTARWVQFRNNKPIALEFFDR